MTVLLLAVAAGQIPADTVVTIAARDGFDLIIAVAAAMVAASFLGVLALCLFLIAQARAASRVVERAAKAVSADRGVESLRKTAANIEAVSGVLRDEVSRLGASVGQLSERVDQASDRMEERIEEFNALIEVIQDEAENAFIDTASTARGMRRGMGELRRAAALRRARGDGTSARRGGDRIRDAIPPNTEADATEPERET